MEGYNVEEAMEYFLKRIDKGVRRPFSPTELSSLLRLAVDADFRYMRENDVIREDGTPGSSYYDDDDAFEYIDEDLCRLTGANEERSMQIAALVDAYMELQEAFLQEKDLLGWDD